VPVPLMTRGKATAKNFAYSSGKPVQSKMTGQAWPVSPLFSMPALVQFHGNGFAF
jgi:hypothetical protein